MTTATAQAFSNIAFIKYWGNTGQEYRRGHTFVQFLDFKNR